MNELIALFDAASPPHEPRQPPDFSQGAIRPSLAHELAELAFVLSPIVLAMIFIVVLAHC